MVSADAVCRAFWIVERRHFPDPVSLGECVKMYEKEADMDGSKPSIPRIKYQTDEISVHILLGPTKAQDVDLCLLTDTGYCDILNAFGNAVVAFVEEGRYAVSLRKKCAFCFFVLPAE